MFTHKDLKAKLARYDEALQVRSEASTQSRDLVKQDAWYRTTLRGSLQKRKADKDGAFMTKDEMVKLMQWKLARGKWRPRLEQYIQEHAEKDIKDATRAIFKALDESAVPAKGSSNAEPIPRDVLKKLTKLKGIGPATASAVLAAYDPKRIPFLSDEAAVGVGKLGDKPEYTEAFLERFIARMHERVAEDEDWAGVDELERACYAAGVISKYGAGKEGKKRREEGNAKDVQALLDKAKQSSGGPETARPDAATAHGGDKLPGEDDAEYEDADVKTPAEGKGKGKAIRTKEKGKAASASASKKRKSVEEPRQGERKSARLSSK
ncbi:hypothetical protein OC844_007811 [Tilletia horrida]|nr:hypothetical protein OC844_007811 [Tilletia horrida]